MRPKSWMPRNRGKMRACSFGRPTRLATLFTCACSASQPPSCLTYCAPVLRTSTSSALSKESLDKPLSRRQFGSLFTRLPPITLMENQLGRPAVRRSKVRANDHYSPVCEDLLDADTLVTHEATCNGPQPSTSSSAGRESLKNSHQPEKIAKKRKAAIFDIKGKMAATKVALDNIDELANDLSAGSSTKKFKVSNALERAKPLPERVRPRSVDDIVGQTHLLGKGALLRSLIDRDAVGSMILWGPPGTGKTTLARAIATQTNAMFREISATSTNSQELRKQFEEAGNVLKLTGKKTILFIDECQRLAKNIQELFLPYIENGTLTCLLATTENPSFRLQTALLSRCRVFVLQKLTVDECTQVLRRGLALSLEDGQDGGRAKALDDDMLRFLANAADGDARVALSTLDLALKADGELTQDELKKSLVKAHLQYDRTGDQHYDLISALHKSVRGSDANAALYWLARMLEGGEDPLYIARRMVRMASEDIGLADSHALPLALTTYQSAQLIGMPECDCILAHCIVYLAEAPKSIRVYKAYGQAKSLVNNEQAYPVPLHIRNAPTKLMKSLGYGKEYLYEPGFAHPVHQTFMPPELEHQRFLRDEDDITAKKVDMSELEDWEHRAGRKWEGRARLEALMHASV